MSSAIFLPLCTFFSYLPIFLFVLQLLNFTPVLISVHFVFHLLLPLLDVSCLSVSTWFPLFCVIFMQFEDSDHIYFFVHFFSVHPNFIEYSSSLSRHLFYFFIQFYLLFSYTCSVFLAPFLVLYFPIVFSCVTVAARILVQHPPGIMYEVEGKWWRSGNDTCRDADVDVSSCIPSGELERQAGCCSWRSGAVFGAR